eukprot:TRINITY_DN8386_c2_g3_i1.p1 TRINITY_DN8386_c2_g3~~TRINITY_DN8386_c2_g3_i1.p1  ORF type:complete len:637 (-),score=118.13 TRINITY_DN8386_c2_g3_i1:113-2023(-)
MKHFSAMASNKLVMISLFLLLISLALGEKARLRSTASAEASSALLSDAQMKTATAQQLQETAMRHAYAILGRMSTSTETEAPQIAMLEKTVLNLVSKTRLTPGTQKFFQQMIGMTNSQMKPKLVTRYNTLKTHVMGQMPAFQTCTDGLISGFRTANEKWNTLSQVKAGLDKCVLDLVCEAGLCNAAGSLSTVNWEIVNIALKSHVGKEKLSGYVTGTWANCDSEYGVTASNTSASSASLLQAEIMAESGEQQTSVQRMLAQSQCQPGATAALTAYTCEKKGDVCKDFINANSYHDFDDCSSTYPKWANLPGGYVTEGVVPTNCTELGGSCCKNPDTRECDKFDSVNSSKMYSSVGSYQYHMYKYWSNMIKLYDDTEAICQRWCDWCSGNQSMCPIDPPDTRCPVKEANNNSAREPVSPFGPAPPPAPAAAPAAADGESTSSTTTTTTTSTGTVVSQQEAYANKLRCQNCTAEQKLLDHRSCEAGQLASKTCDDYKKCYIEANVSLAAAFNTVCAPGGDLSIIKNEYYGVLRIECLVNALKAQPSVVREEINTCTRKKITDYDLTLFTIEGCDAGWPEYMAGQNDMCNSMRNVAAHVNISGTRAYEQHWYRNVPNRIMCKSACCLSRPKDYVPPVTR